MLTIAWAGGVILCRLVNSTYDPAEGSGANLIAVVFIEYLFSNILPGGKPNPIAKSHESEPSANWGGLLLLRAVGVDWERNKILTNQVQRREKMRRKTRKGRKGVVYNRYVEGF
jgi:hypothetical protein